MSVLVIYSLHLRMASHLTDKVLDRILGLARRSGFEMTRASSRGPLDALAHPVHSYITANLRTEILDFGGFDSSRVLILRG